MSVDQQMGRSMTDTTTVERSETEFKHCLNRENFCGAWCHCVCRPCREIRMAERIAKDGETLRQMIERRKSSVVTR